MSALFCAGCSKGEGKIYLEQRSGNWSKADEAAAGKEEWQGDSLYLRMIVRQSQKVEFAISADGQSFAVFGKPEYATPGRWVGAKVGLFAVCQEENKDITNAQNNGGNKTYTGAKGSVMVDYFVFEPLT